MKVLKCTIIQAATIQMEEWEKETPFDYNEIHILYSSVHMYLIELKFTHQHRFIPPCIALCKQLSLIVEHVDREANSQH